MNYLYNTFVSSNILCKMDMTQTSEHILKRTYQNTNKLSNNHLLQLNPFFLLFPRHQPFEQEIQYFCRPNNIILLQSPILVLFKL